MINPQDLNDKNSIYIGYGLYAYVDKENKIWVLDYDIKNSISISNEICFKEESTFKNFCRFAKKIYDPRDGEIW